MDSQSSEIEFERRPILHICGDVQVHLVDADDPQYIAVLESRICGKCREEDEEFMLWLEEE